MRNRVGATSDVNFTVVIGPSAQVLRNNVVITCDNLFDCATTTPSTLYGSAVDGTFVTTSSNINYYTSSSTINYHGQSVVAANLINGHRIGSAANESFVAHTCISNFVAGAILSDGNGRIVSYLFNVNFIGQYTR